MSRPDDGGGLGRRDLLAGSIGMVAAALANTARAVPRSEVKSWHMTTDVLVVGSGAAGVCAALAAREAGSRVLLVETLAGLGGASAMSPGAIYAGGGTALQRAAGIDDSAEAMFEQLMAAGDPAPVPRVQRYCEESAAHFDWLVAMGVTYSDRISTARGVPRDGASLFYAGDERAASGEARARVPLRGHVPSADGRPGGRLLMDSLIAKAAEVRVGMLAGAAARNLVIERDGRVAGALLDINDRPRAVRVAQGVVLASGGFGRNPAMLRQHAPQLQACAEPWGTEAELGHGINIAIAAGAGSRRMHEGMILMDIAETDSVPLGVLVNSAGQRFVSEAAFPAGLGHAITFQQGGKAWLITDRVAASQALERGFSPVATANTIGDIAVALDLPPGALQQTAAYYNRQAANGRDPVFHKEHPWVRPLQGPPYRAWDLSCAGPGCRVQTLGGLTTALDGAVLDGLGEVIPGLFACGRTAAGLPVAPYAAHGLSLGDCTFFGRLAGAGAARVS